METKCESAEYSRMRNGNIEIPFWANFRGVAQKRNVSNHHKFNINQYFLLVKIFHSYSSENTRSAVAFYNASHFWWWQTLQGWLCEADRDESFQFFHARSQHCATSALLAAVSIFHIPKGVPFRAPLDPASVCLRSAASLLHVVFAAVVVRSDEYLATLWLQT